jgi:hypothetical protein
MQVPEEGVRASNQAARGTTLHRDRELPGSLRDGPHQIKAQWTDRLSPRFKIALLPRDSSILPKAAVGIYGIVHCCGSGANRAYATGRLPLPARKVAWRWAGSGQKQFPERTALLLRGGISRRRVYRPARCRSPMQADLVAMCVGGAYASYSTLLSG